MLCIARILNNFEAASTLKTNLDKFAESFSKNIPLPVREEFAAQIGVLVVENHDKYLGLSSIMGLTWSEVAANTWVDETMDWAILSLLGLLWAWDVLGFPDGTIGLTWSEVATDTWVDEVLRGRVGCHVCGPFGPNVLVGLNHDPSRGMSQASSPGDILGLESGDVSDSNSSAYELALRQPTISGPSNVRVREVTEEGDWRFLWKARVPPKIQLFAWKVCQEAIPVAINLKKRGVQVEAACGRCSSGEEDMLHVLLSCEFARQVRCQ
ncbi:UNVERIFIED_CONTAM: hypothetical protein Scaly_0588500 [Sesamum calycinum]|uniref:Reverse transcriptase zinc-binding domain-containing protein n=1 Tax=Sesamum calycinum TaxID=2727403 RepID=A0AAW2RS44_9LAMI